jgi:hypothetical protein
MKKFIYNQKSKRFIDADGINGKKIVETLRNLNKKVVFFKDKKGSEIFTIDEKLQKPLDKKKLKRCPKGFRRNNITGECEKIEIIEEQKPLDKKKIKRCPKGFRKNNITGECEKIKTIQEKKKQIEEKKKQIEEKKIQQQEKKIQQQKKNLQDYKKIKDIQKKMYIDKVGLKTKWSLIDVPGDNHCGFHALSLFLRYHNKLLDGNNEDNNIIYLRQQLINIYKIVKENIKNGLESPFLLNDVESRIESLTNDPTEWLADEDMVLFSKVYELCFFVLRHEPTTDELVWHIISYDNPFGDDFIESIENCKKNKWIFLYNPTYPGLHYDLIMPKDNTYPKNLFTDYKISGPSFSEKFFNKYIFSSKSPFVQSQTESETQKSQTDYEWQSQKQLQKQHKQLQKQQPHKQLQKQQQKQQPYKQSTKNKINIKTDQEIIKIIEACFSKKKN